MKYNFSQNADNDWNGFDGFSEPAPSRATENIRKSTSSTSMKMKPKSSIEDFSNLDVKSKVDAAPPKAKNDKEDDFWEMLNS